MIRLVLIISLSMLLTSNALAVHLKVAVASNFKSTAQKLADDFEKKTDHKITLVSASTGGLYSLIYHGAPYDIFLSADTKRPQKLVDANLAYPNSLFTYAIGQLAFWMPNQQNLTLENIHQQIKKQKGKLAIANPRLAPYGLSASEYIKENKLTTVIQSKLIKGNNVTQALQFIESGNAQSGFVSYSELLHAGVEDNYILLEPGTYPPIKQQGVILRRTKHYQAAQAFVDFIRDQGCDTILASGYALEPSYYAESH